MYADVQIPSPPRTTFKSDISGFILYIPLFTNNTYEKINSYKRLNKLNIMHNIMYNVKYINIYHILYM